MSSPALKLAGKGERLPLSHVKGVHDFRDSLIIFESGVMVLAAQANVNFMKNHDECER